MKGMMELFPASYRGMFAHCYYWATSKTGNYVFHNPAYVKSENDISIYCVHGTADRPQSFSRIAERLIEKGLPSRVKKIVLVSFQGRGKGNSIEYFSIHLIDEILANNDDRIVFLDHSRGGLVTSWATEYLAAERGIIVEFDFCICVPFQGSPLALAPLSRASQSVHQMEVCSVFLEGLRKKIVSSASTRYYFIVAADDAIVPVDFACIPEYVAQYPESLIQLKTRHGHLSVMSSHELVARINAIISRKEDEPALTTVIHKPLDSVRIIDDYIPGMMSSSSSAPVAEQSEPLVEEDEDTELGLFSW